VREEVRFLYIMAQFVNRWLAKTEPTLSLDDDVCISCGFGSLAMCVGETWELHIGYRDEYKWWVVQGGEGQCQGKE